MWNIYRPTSLCPPCLFAVCDLIGPEVTHMLDVTRHFSGNAAVTWIPAPKKPHTRHSCRCTCETRAGGWGKKAQNSGMFGLLSVRLMNVCVCVSCQRWCSVKTTHNVLHALCYSLWTSDSCWCVMCGAISTSMMLCEKQTVLTEDIFSNGTVGFWLVIGRKVSVNFLQQQLWH